MKLQTYFQQIIEELQRTLSQISEQKGEEIITAILNSQRIFIAGAGKSGLAIKGFAMRLMHLGFDVYVVGDVTTPGITKKDLLVIASGSGTTESLCAIAEKVKNIGSQIVLLTILEDSPIAQVADIILTIPAPTPKIEKETGFHSIQPMGALFEQSLVLIFDALTLVLMNQIKSDSDTMFTRHANLE